VNSIPTPFLPDGEIDRDGVRNIIDKGIGGASTVACLTAGDSQLGYLTDDEIKELVRILVEHTGGRSLTVAATSICGTKEAVALAHFCKETGADILMPRAYDGAGTYQVGVKETVEFYRAVAKVMPVMMVGWPPHEALDELLNEENILSLKEDGTEGYAIRTAAKYGRHWQMMTGGTLWRHYTQWPYGCRAFFSHFHSYAPHFANDYWGAVQKGDEKSALEVITKVELPLFELAEKYLGWQPLWRAILTLGGIIQSQALRSPAQSVPDKELEKLQADLESLGVL
jgi:dihydrodipicolinate synthase/N-acetylneuraminate lyase